MHKMKSLNARSLACKFMVRTVLQIIIIFINNSWIVATVTTTGPAIIQNEMNAMNAIDAINGTNITNTFTKTNDTITTATTDTTTTKTTIKSLLTTFDALPTALPLAAKISTSTAIIKNAHQLNGIQINDENWLNHSNIIHDAKQELEQEHNNELGTAAPLRQDPLGPLNGCSLSEFTCINSKCIPINKYCDRVNDCGDNSDEPRFCTRCNRTYYGDLGMTNSLELLRPKDERLPFMCELNFTAAGGIHGDIIQITIERFTVGRFCSYVIEGCPDGYLQISEAARTSVGGMWCGTMDDGPVVFYSETRTLILTLLLLRPSKGTGGSYFDFRISYKVLPRENAIVRFGGSAGTANINSNATSYTFNDNEPHEEDPWVTNTRIVGPNSGKNATGSTSSRRNKDKDKDNAQRKKNKNQNRERERDRGDRDRERDRNRNRDRERDRDRDLYDRDSVYHQYPHPDASYYDDFDYREPPHNYNQQRNATKHPKSFAINKTHPWPSHTNKQINNYYGDRREPKYYLGTLISGTHCSRIFSDCDKKACRLQSPNYPGIYPRNLTCYYAIRQHDVPQGKHALITVRQSKGDLVWIQTPFQQNTNKKKGDKERYTPHLTTWDECDIIQDYITIYDGYTTRDPVVLKFCGGGGKGLPRATSSGPELLIEFVTSPFGTFKTSPLQSRTLNGFQLEIVVEFVDTQSYLYAKNKQMCEFWIRGTGHGDLESPRHSLPPNTTCLYHLQGTESIYRPYDQFHSPRRTGIILPQLSRFKVWISVLKFNLSPKFSTIIEETNAQNSLTSHKSSSAMGAIISGPIGNSRGGGAGYHYQNEECNGMLRIWDGPLREVPVCNDLNCERDGKLVAKYGQNLTSVIARFCYNRVPKSCDHGVMNESLARPCTVLESYVSGSDYVTLELKTAESTVLQPVNFKLRYEFVDYQQDGTPMHTEHECHRKFVSSEMDRRDMGKFRSVRNIFLFGRGGSLNLNCVYRFESEKDERIRITIKKVVTTNRQCLSRVDADTRRSYCFGDQRASLQIMEQSTDGYALFQRGCACNSSNTSDLPIVYTSSSRALEIHFTAANMTALDDPDHLNFEATYEFIKLPLLCKEVKRISGTSGTVSMANENKECRTRQWIIEPSEDQYLYVRMNGAYLRKHSPKQRHLIPEDNLKSSFAIHCPTRARFVFTNGEGLSVTACPASENSADNSFVEIFSSGWDSSNDFRETKPMRSISIEYIDPDEEDYQFTWFEMVPRVSLGLVAENCAFICPELDACVNASVWCDGINHCPSGYDESFTHCSALLKLPAEILAGISVSTILVFCAFGAYIYRRVKRSCRGSSILQTRLKSLSSMDTATFDDKDMIC